jgi:hypothetical protein
MHNKTISNLERREYMICLHNKNDQFLTGKKQFKSAKNDVQCWII